MGSKTAIDWTDSTWNPLRGCSRVSEGCRNCYAEKVAHGLLVAVFVEMRGQQRRVQAKMSVQKVAQVGVGRLHCRLRFQGHKNFHAIAGGDNHALRHSGHRGQSARSLRQILAGYGDPLAQLNGRGLVVDADEGQGHLGPYLCTWLKTLAASTASITRKTAPER